MHCLTLRYACGRGSHQPNGLGISERTIFELARVFPSITYAEHLALNMVRVSKHRRSYQAF